MSEWRQGQVDSSDAGTVVIKPLAGQGPQAEAPAVDEDAEEEDEEEEGERPLLPQRTKPDIMM